MAALRAVGWRSQPPEGMHASFSLSVPGRQRDIVSLSSVQPCRRVTGSPSASALSSLQAAIAFHLLILRMRFDFSFHSDFLEPGGPAPLF